MVDPHVSTPHLQISGMTGTFCDFFLLSFKQKGVMGGGGGMVIILNENAMNGEWNIIIYDAHIYRFTPILEQSSDLQVDLVLSYKTAQVV